jgi:hypothetical protein
MTVRFGGHHALAIALALLPAFTACKKEDATVVPAKAPEVAPLPEVFVPPAEGLISPQVARAYAQARAEMVQVNARLLDSLGASGVERKAVYARALELASEAIARRNGLRGAAEYRWVQDQAAMSPQNRETLAQAGILIP